MTTTIVVPASAQVNCDAATRLASSMGLGQTCSSFGGPFASASVPDASG